MFQPRRNGGRAAIPLALAALLPAGAALAAPVPVAVTILSVACTQDDECDAAGAEALGESWPDFYAKIFINGVETITTRADDDQKSITPLGWTASAIVDNAVTPQVPIGIQIWDHDSTSGDDLLDASPQNDNNNFNVTLNLATGTWSGDTTTTCVTGDGVDTDDDEYYPVRVCFAISTLSASGDADLDGLLDGWETAGYDADGDGAVDVNLPSMDANPLRKDLFLELDYETGRAPTRDGIAEMKAAFAAAPLPNPDGSTGITLHVDVGNLIDPTADEGGIAGTCANGLDEDGDGTTDGADGSCRYLRSSREVVPGNCANGVDDDGDGQVDGADPNCRVGDNFGGGQQLAPVNACGLDGTFYVAKAANFAANRAWIFRYAIQGAGATPPPPGGCAGGQGEIGGNDFISHNLDAGTLMHELGHTLNLQHGGTDSVNCKPNYYSVMNYNMQSGIPRIGGGLMLDYSPPLLPLAGPGRAGAPLGALDETLLNETVAVSPGDGTNQTVFMDGLSRLVTAPGNGAINWTGDADPPFETLAPVDINNGIPAAPGVAAVGAPGCANGALTVLAGAADWPAISVPFRQFGDSASSAVNPADDTDLPTDDDLQRMQDQMRTTDLAVSLTASPDPVAAGTALALTAQVANLGPNPALSVVATLTVPPETTRTGPVPAGCSEPVPGTLLCPLGWLAAGETRDIPAGAALAPDLVYLAGAPFPTTATATVNDPAGSDSDPASNAAQATVTAVAVADLSVDTLAIANRPVRMRVGEDLVIDLPASIGSAGPSSPMDTVLQLVSTADPGARVSTTWVETFQPALATGEARPVMSHPILTCLTPGRHRFDFVLTIRPDRAPDTDPNPDNNAQHTAIEVDCRGEREAIINLEPGRIPNRLSLASRENTLAILTTRAGEYGLALPFDATLVDPRSLRFGSRRMVEGLEPGTALFSDFSTPDSFERIPPEVLQDGDRDMQIFHFDAPSSGLRPDDTEVCVTGIFRDPVSGADTPFQGCDSAEIVGN